ncbi:MAG TPA: 3-isopropylmalate dehydrogenase [Bacillota bacterium]|nr:3-isopropylmalate dehydrogenase [Bacillota bacterium]
MSKKIVLLPGDGIGPEIMDAAEHILNCIALEYGHQFSCETHVIGGSAIDQTNQPLPDETIAACKEADAILLGAVGGAKWETLPPSNRPEQGLLGLRKALGLFANVRPVKGFPPLLHASPLKEEVIDGSDILIIRELTSGLYFGEPRERRENGHAAVDTLYYNREEIERIVDYAFKSAQDRKKHVTSVDKANVLETSRLWREVVEEKAQQYPDITVEHVLVDAAAMKLITDPSRFDVLVTENLFGDILSDEASVLTGSIGMLPSASLTKDGVGLYEPVHGSAPDIAGKGIANPLGMILSVAMMLRHSFEMEEEARAIEQSVQDCLEEGYYTKDLHIPNGQCIGTKEMTKHVIEQITSKSVSDCILNTYA